ncbi:16S rRNA (cytidine(1402)-2'-O)-methyltransferase [Candidatus Daviesbacteria bacterium]|nr:16S rRNA (cytidine(1402)-2'-O)-methyltransferase [Candidatus Daviesbacteria bacterium]
MLFIVATPIGNLKDITLRALEALQNSDAIICEDTRRTSILLNHYQIKKPMFALNDFNEAKQFPAVIERLKKGENLVLVSDAGTPLVSDPGYKLVRECIEQNISIDSLPGPSAVLTALTLSGLPPDKFLFLGYPPEKPSHRIKLFEDILKAKDIIKMTYIFFVSPYKLLKTLEDINSTLGDIELVLASELTKIHQRVKKEKVSTLLEQLKSPKGEYVMLFNLS